jgi:hypothetical protein
MRKTDLVRRSRNRPPFEPLDGGDTSRLMQSETPNPLDPAHPRGIENNGPVSAESRSQGETISREMPIEIMALAFSLARIRIC